MAAWLSRCVHAPQLASLLACPDMQRYLSHSVPHGQTAAGSADALSPYFFPAASLLFSISAADDEQTATAGATSKGNATGGFGEGKRDLRRELYVLMDFQSLLSNASALTLTGCGSLAHSTRAAPPLSEDNSQHAHTAGSPNPPECEQNVYGGDSNKHRSTASTARPVTGNTAPARPPRCLQLIAPRYRHDLVIPFPAFQELLHLFMQYLVQCRQAYEQLRLQKETGEGVAANRALATPDFCDFGYELKLRESDSGGIILEFLSLIAMHDGNERLFIQWGDAVRICQLVIL